MDLVIEGEVKHFIPIKQFRQDFDLPLSFGMAMFEPKDFTGLGRIDNAGAEMNLIRQAILDAIPTQMPLPDWLNYIPHLSSLLQSKLHEVNPEIGLKTEEIEYAVAGFQDICQNLIYAMIRARSADEAVPEFAQVYTDWLSQTLRVSSPARSYIHKGAVWAIQMINTVFGRLGIIVWMNDETYYVYDNCFACPAEGFMYSLMQEVAKRIVLASDPARASTPNQ